MNYNNTPIKLPAIRDRSFQGPERHFNGLNHLVSPVQNKHKQFNFSGQPQQNYGTALIRQASDSNRSVYADGPPQGLNLSLAKMSSFANKAERNLNDSNVFNNSYQSPYPQKSPLPLQSKSKAQFSSFGKEKQLFSENSFHHNPPQFNESINYGSPLLDQQHSKMYMNSDSNPSLFQKKIGPKSFSSSKLLKGIIQVPGGQNSGARFNANYEADSSFAHQENQSANASSLRINKFKSQGSIQLPELSPPSHFDNNNHHPNNFQLPAIQKSHFGFNQGMLNSYEMSTDRSHRRMVSLPSNEAIANVLNGSFNVHHQQPSSVGQTYQNLNDTTLKEKVHHHKKNLKPLPTEQLVGLPIYQAQNSARVNGYENDIDYLKYLMAQGSASTDTTPKHEFTKTSFDDKEKKKKKKKKEKEIKPKAKPVTPPKMEEPVKKEPVDKEKKLKKVVIRENHRLLERELERERIERVRGNMRTLLWIMAFPRLLRNRIMDFVDEKRLEVNKSAKQDIKDVVNSVSNFIKKNCFTYLQLLYDKKQALNIVPYDKKAKKDLNKKSIEQRSKLISTSLLSILTSVMNATINHEIPMGIIEFFASITENLSVVPTGFLFPFEINRLELTQFLTLKNMNPMRSKMMIGMFFLIRMLVFYFLTQPWNAKVKVTETPLLLENLKICSSVLYHVIFNFFRKRLPIVKNHEGSQESEKKLKPRNGLLFCFGESERPDAPVTEDEVIIGLFSRTALNDYFLLEKGAVEEMNDIIEQWLDVVYTKVQVHQVCLQKPAGKQKAIFE